MKILDFFKGADFYDVFELVLFLIFIPLLCGLNQWGHFVLDLNSLHLALGLLKDIHLFLAGLAGLLFALAGWIYFSSKLRYSPKVLAHLGVFFLASFFMIAAGFEGTILYILSVIAYFVALYALTAFKMPERGFYILE